MMTSFFDLGFVGAFWNLPVVCSVLVAKYRKESSSGRDSPTEITNCKKINRLICLLYD
jgi:hypothetical protein